MAEEWEGQLDEGQQSPFHAQEAVSKNGPDEQVFSNRASIMPAFLPSFVGREKACEMARALLLKPEVRLLTFLGAGGIGKTRLAVAAVNEEVRSCFVDGVYFVSLVSLTHVQQVLPTIMQALDIQNTKEQAAIDILISTLHEKYMLLLLDNFEHVIEAAIDITLLLKACPHLKIAVTSRSVLQVQGEYEFWIPPLTLPDLKHLPPPDRLFHYTAIALFIERVQAVKPDFVLNEQNAPLVAELCVRLDGLPLAIELAAPRLKLLSLQNLLLRLEQHLPVLTDGSRDLHERQRTLQATMKWSYDLLSLEEKKLFCRLFVFVGGFTVEAVETICQVNNDLSPDILDLLSTLLNESLIYASESVNGEPRLLLMETLRAYSLECLPAHEEEVIRRQHAVYFLRWLEEREPEFYKHDQVVVLGCIERELANLHQALQWFLQQEEYEQALRLASATGHFWTLCGSLMRREYFCEGKQFLGFVMPLLEKQAISDYIRADTLLHYGVLLSFLEELELAETIGHRSLALYRRLSSVSGCMQTSWLLAHCLQKRNRYAEARVLTEEAFQMATQLQHDFSKAFSMRRLGLLSFYTGEYVQASLHFEMSLDLARKMQSPFFLAELSRHLAEVCYAQGNYKKARYYCEESLSQSRLLAITCNIAWSLTILASIEWREGNTSEALHYAKEALDEHTIVAEPEGLVWTTLWLARIVAHRQQTDLAYDLTEKVMVTIKAEHDLWYAATFLEMLADVGILLHELRWTALLWGKAVALREEIHSPLSPAAQIDCEMAQTLIRNDLSESTFALLWAEGRRLGIAQVLALRSSILNSLPHELLASSEEPATALKGALASLTRRELEVLRLLASGLSNAQIAEQLTIRRVTVNSYLRAIYSKLAVSSRTAAMRYAIDHHLL